MRTAFPFPYRVSRKTAGRKRVGSAPSFHLDYVEADVPEVSASEFEVVARWRVVGSGMSAPKPAPSVCASWRGVLYVPVVSAGGDVIRSLPSSRGGRFTYELAYGVLGTRYLSPYEDATLRNGEIGRVATPPPPGDILESNAVANGIVAQACVDGLVLVDGEVWRRVPSVRFRVSRPHTSGGVYRDIETAPCGFDIPPPDRGPEHLLPPSSHWYFGLSEAEMLRAATQDYSCSDSFAGFELLSAEPLRFHGRTELIARSMDYAVRKTSSTLGGASASAVLDWALMRQEAVISGSGHVPVSEEAEAALRRFAESGGSWEAEKVDDALRVLDRHYAPVEEPPIRTTPSIRPG